LSDERSDSDDEDINGGGVDADEAVAKQELD